MKKILVIGGGSIGERHLHNLLLLGEKDVVVVEVKPERAAVLHKKYGTLVVGSLEEVLQTKKFDIVFVCTPSIYHLENALLFAERGCDLFIEKPLSHSSEGIDRLITIVKDKKLVTMVGSNWKFYPLFQKMKELLGAGAIGRVLSARCESGQYLPDWHPWEDYRSGYSANKKLGGGVLFDSHEFDYLTWFIGDAVKKLSCFSAKRSNLEIDVEDTAAVIVEFTGGVIGEIHLDYTQRFGQRNFEFFGETGTVIWDINSQKVVVKNKEFAEVSFPLADDYDVNTMYVEEVRHFLECVDERTETITPVAKGAVVVKLILAAKESAEKNCAIFIG